MENTMNKPTPKNEPVTYATLVALAVGALASYGMGITDELKEFLIVAVPVIIGAIVARQNVTPVE